MLGKETFTASESALKDFPVLYFRLLLCFMCCTTLLSMWLSNTSTTAMVMPIVEAVLQELVNAEEECEVISTAGSTIIEENEPIGICQ